jgi:cytochrome c oxidase subunit 1
MPRGFGNSLEWAKSCPPPRHNFTELPRVRSERPAFELHYPHLVERSRAETHVGDRGHAELPEARPPRPLNNLPVGNSTTRRLTCPPPDWLPP